MATNFNINVYQGSNFSGLTTGTDFNSNPINLSGWALSGYAKYQYSSTGLFNFNTVIDSTLTGGLINIILTEAMTSKLPAGYLSYEILAYNSGMTNYIRAVNGYIAVNPSIVF